MAFLIVSSQDPGGGTTNHVARIMIDFYTLTSPNVQKIYIMLEETHLP
jgi:hypothetical protein